MACGRSVFCSTNKTDPHDIAEISLKVALNTITKTPTLSWNSKFRGFMIPTKTTKIGIHGIKKTFRVIEEKRR